MKQFLKNLAYDGLNNHLFLLLALGFMVFQDLAAAALNLLFAFYFKLDDIRKVLEAGADIESIVINTVPAKEKTNESC